VVSESFLIRRAAALTAGQLMPASLVTARLPKMFSCFAGRRRGDQPGASAVVAGEIGGADGEADVMLIGEAVEVLEKRIASSLDIPLVYSGKGWVTMRRVSTV